MDGYDSDSAFKSFVKTINSMPSWYYTCVLTMNGLFVFNKNDNKFYSSDGKESYNFDDKILFTYNENLDTNIMCIITFHSLDEMLDYIRIGKYKNDISKIMLRHQNEINNAK